WKKTPKRMRGSAPLEADVLERGRPRIRIDHQEGGVGDAGPDGARPDVLVDRGEAHALVDELLDLVEQGLALFPVELAGLLLPQRVDVGIGAARVDAVARHELAHAGGGVAVERADAHAHALELLAHPRRDEGRALHRADL